MSNQMTALPTDDGWNDAANEAGERMIRGQILRFADWRFIAGKEATVIPNGTQLVAVATAAMWVRWEDGRPVEHRVRGPGQKLPERDELGFDDEHEWKPGVNGDPIDPWRNTRLVYLVDPISAELYTFSTASFGGRRAIADLGDQIARMRSVHADAVPIVELQAVEMPTKYGKKSRPLFKIIGWKTASGEAPGERTVTPQAAMKAINHREMDDEIPY